MVLVFPPRDDEEQYIVLPYFWLPEETLQLRVRRDHVMYDKWERQGFIHTTEGNVVHYGFIEQFITKLGERFNIREIAYDRWNATMMVQTLEDDGFNMVPFGQGFRDMSPPTKELMRIVLERKLNHGGHPVLRWNMDNAEEPGRRIRLRYPWTFDYLTEVQHAPKTKKTLPLSRMSGLLRAGSGVL